MHNTLTDEQLTRHFIERQGARLSYQTAGDGRPITLVQGLGVPGAMWKDFGGDLVERGLSVLMPDNRGSGASGIGRRPFSVATLADDVAEMIRRTYDRPTLQVGISMGGMIAQHLAVRHPDLIDGLLLVSTTPGLREGKMASPDTYRLLLKMFLLPASSNFDDAQRLLAHHSHRPRLPELFRRWDLVLAEQPTSKRGFALQLQAALRHDIGERLSQVRVPTHILTGRNDRLIPPENSVRLAEKIPHARLTLVDEAGHLLPFEQPHALANAFDDVLHRST